MEYFKVILEMAEFAAAVVLAIVPVIIARIHTGKFELDKTLQAAEDVAHAVKDLEEGIGQIEEIRGKLLSPKMRRKAEARMKRVMSAPIKKPAARATKSKAATKK
jgi:hypothetical protein